MIDISYGCAGTHLRFVKSYGQSYLTCIGSCRAFVLLG